MVGTHNFYVLKHDNSSTTIKQIFRTHFVYEKKSMVIELKKNKESIKLMFFESLLIRTSKVLRFYHHILVPACTIVNKSG